MWIRNRSQWLATITVVTNSSPARPMPIFVTKRSSDMRTTSMRLGAFQVDWQSGSGNASTIGIVWSITRDFQVNSAIFVTNDSPHEVLAYVAFTHTFHLWHGKE
jgi:hypothetical protein